MNLLIQEFPDEVRWKLRRMAMDSGVTLRELVIKGLSRLVAGEGSDGKVEGPRREVGERIKGQVERLSKKAGEQEAEEELRF